MEKWEGVMHEATTGRGLSIRASRNLNRRHGYIRYHNYAGIFIISLVIYLFVGKDPSRQDAGNQRRRLNLLPAAGPLAPWFFNFSLLKLA